MNVVLKGSESVVEAHILPCHIAYNGKADVSKHFVVTDGEDGIKHASFRGRALQGTKVDLPEGYTAHVHHIPTKSTSEFTYDENGEETTEAIESQATESFKEFVLWNHNSPPDMRSDKLVRGVREWVNLASMIHDEEDTEDESNEEEAKVAHLEIPKK
ncbi:hypothetical protein NEOLI_003806 [Neolecta irregularis DAH-3]|uniref:Uncharacterized protein n=1 Tax=Neolecta irregularis (strain DAH-3) TaxID=1198029 RepID=A0A1U7LNW8_NEOID|nr:hypothetical protein NEOLI_003806 [Neolecta irregularis DAH-3]|eukprot:OLL24344.1 hypothetical protein NEOLI_003806 [Neolecta irregularis DAH-3]